MPEHIEQAQFLLGMGLGASIVTTALMSEQGLTAREADNATDAAFLLLEEHHKERKTT